MGRVPIHYIDLRAFCYATEDEANVTRAIRSYLPEHQDIERTVTEGHYGDQILVLAARVDNADDIRFILSRIRRLDDWDHVITEIPDRVDDDCSFHLQLDKQSAYQGHLRRGTGLALRAKIEAYPAKRPTAIKNLLETFAG